MPVPLYKTTSGICVYDYEPGPLVGTRDGSHQPTGRAPSISPSEPIVVMVHGTLDRGTSFIRLRNALSSHHVIAYDRRGYHRSRDALGPSGTEHDGSFASHLEDLFEVLDEREAVVVGHSYGGNLALAAAYQRPDLVVACVAFEPPLPWESWWPKPGQRYTGEVGGSEYRPVEIDIPPEEAAELFFRRIVGDSKWERLPEESKRQRRSEGATMVAELKSLRMISAPYVAESIIVPVAIGRGSETAKRQVKGTDQLASQIPNSKLWVIEGANHGAHLTHPKQVSSLVEWCLDQT